MDSAFCLRKNIGLFPGHYQVYYRKIIFILAEIFANATVRSTAYSRLSLRGLSVLWIILVQLSFADG